jgi:hypothetical protein
LRRLAVETWFVKLAVETKLVRFAVETWFVKLAVETKLVRFAVETTFVMLETYPEVPRPLTVDAS